MSKILGMLAVGILTAIVLPLRETLIGLFIPNNPEALAFGCERLFWLYSLHFIGTAMSVSSACLRGMGESIKTMVISIFGVCVLRVLWIYTVVAKWNSLKVIYAVYPITWGVTALAFWVLFAVLYK